MSNIWSPPFHGCEHLSQPGKKSYATVVAHDGFAQATFNTYPIRFDARKQKFSDVASAKAACEEWLTSQVV